MQKIFKWKQTALFCFVLLCFSCPNAWAQKSTAIEEQKKFSLPPGMKILSHLTDGIGQHYYLTQTAESMHHGNFSMSLQLLQFKNSETNLLWSRGFQQDGESGGCGGTIERSRMIGLRKGLLEHKLKAISPEKISLLITLMNCETRQKEHETVFFIKMGDHISIIEESIGE